MSNSRPSKLKSEIKDGTEVTCGSSANIKFSKTNYLQLDRFLLPSFFLLVSIRLVRMIN